MDIKAMANNKITQNFIFYAAARKYLTKKTKLKNQYNPGAMHLSPT